jgi:hypothetical protein
MICVNRPAPGAVDATRMDFGQSGKNSERPIQASKGDRMTTVLIIVCIVFCVGVVVAIVGHLGYGVASDHGWRRHIHRYHANRKRERERTTA